MNLSEFYQMINHIKGQTRIVHASQKDASRHSFIILLTDSILFFTKKNYDF